MPAVAVGAVGGDQAVLQRLAAIEARLGELAAALTNRPDLDRTPAGGAPADIAFLADALAQAEASPGAGPETEALRREVREQWQSMSRRAAGRQQAAAGAYGARSSAPPRSPSTQRTAGSQPASMAPPGRDGDRGPAIEYLTGAPGP